MRIRIVLAEDQDLVRDSISVLLSSDPSLEVVGSASDGLEAVETCRRLRPDIAVLDVRMPRMDGLQAAGLILSEGAAGKVVILTTFEEDGAIDEALALGAAGIFLKDIKPETFIAALKTVMDGLIVLHPAVAPRLAARKSPEKAALPHGLTARDLDFIRCVVEGMGNKAIAAREACSEGTVKNRISSILSKMDLHDRTQIAVYAIKNGLLKDFY